MTTTVEQEFEPIILAFDDLRKQRQMTFLIDLKRKLNELLTEYNLIGLPQPFIISDLDRIESTNPIDFVREKVMGGIDEKPSIGGITLSKRKLASLVDLETEHFISLYHDIKIFIVQERANAGKHPSNPVSLEFSSQFFQLADELTIDNHFFDKWIEQKCIKVTENHLQNKVYHELERLAQTLNTLRDLSFEFPDNGTNKLIQVMKMHPRFMVESYAFRLIQLRGDKFSPNPECSLFNV